MPDAIESRAFRAAARRNCIMYLGIPIYVSSIPSLAQMSLPSFRAQSPDGAVSQLFSTLVNMSTQIAQIRKNERMTDSKPVPGVSYGEIGDMSMSLSGDVYFVGAGDYNAFQDTLTRISKTYGWAVNTSSALGTSTYAPNQNDLTNIDPVQAAVKGMVLGTVSDMLDTATILGVSKSTQAGSAEEQAYFEARDRYKGGSIFNTAAIQYYSNTPKGVQGRWNSLSHNRALVPTLLIDGAVRGKANIGYIPSSISVTPEAFVMDGTGMYPSKCSISMQLHNPLGGLLANCTSGAPSGNSK